MPRILFPNSFLDLNLELGKAGSLGEYGLRYESLRIAASWAAVDTANRSLADAQPVAYPVRL
jgi:hypothetical protein